MEVADEGREVEGVYTAGQDEAAGETEEAQDQPHDDDDDDDDNAQLSGDEVEEAIVGNTQLMGVSLMLTLHCLVGGHH